MSIIRGQLWNIWNLVLFEDKFQLSWDNKSPNDTLLNKNGLFSFNIAFVLSIAEKSLHATQCLKPATGTEVIAAITDKGLHSNTSLRPNPTSHFAHFKNKWRCWQVRRGGGGGVKGWDLIPDRIYSWLGPSSADSQGFVGRSLFRAFVCAAKLTSCSSMAVDVEAEVSATKRSQVEVIKILPEWRKTKRGQILETDGVITLPGCGQAAKRRPFTVRLFRTAYFSFSCHSCSRQTFQNEPVC